MTEVDKAGGNDAVIPTMVTDSRQNGFVQPLLTDLYQLTMAYAYWKAGRVGDQAVFDLFFRKNPFSGEFTLFAGLNECLIFLQKFRYSETDIAYLRQVMPADVDAEFFDYLSQLDASELTVYAIEEGSIVFPRVPLMRVEGPLIVCQLVETVFLNLVNFSSLVATNAARYGIACGAKRPQMKLLEFGLRRAQGPDGGVSASKYAYIGGFDGTSNVLAGKLFGIPVRGTHAHAFVTSFTSLTDVENVKLDRLQKSEVDENGTAALENGDETFTPRCVRWRTQLAEMMALLSEEAHDGELAAFISFASSFPRQFLALVDTYDVAKSGLLNFLAVAIAMAELGYLPIGIRLDSGDLAYLSQVARDTFEHVAKLLDRPWLASLTIVASNDINEETILSLNDQGHAIDCFGIGTHLVTCQRQPALGCVYKLVEINGEPRIKLSQDVEKVTMPGRKSAYRLYSADGHALIDLLQREDEAAPVEGSRILCRHPFQESKRAWVIPSRVERLHTKCWSGDGATASIRPLDAIRDTVSASLQTLRQDHKRSLNPTPYKVSVSDGLYHYLHELWLENQPIGELS